VAGPFCGGSGGGKIGKRLNTAVKSAVLNEKNKLNLRIVGLRLKPDHSFHICQILT
jgi:hypothetical protein